VNEATTAPADLRPQRFLWDYAVGIWGLHALAALAVLPWLFSWAGVAAMAVGVFIFGQGINLGYHRLLTHRGLKVPRWLEYTLVTIALCCFQDTPIRWVTHHRVHHRYSDQEKDPHSPHAGFFHAHMGWIFRANRDTQGIAAYSAYSRDLLDDPFYRALERHWWLPIGIYLAHAALFFLAGLAIGGAEDGLRLGLSLLVWGVALRTVLVWHITWSVNSFAHVFGYRSHETKEDSRNNWAVGLIAAGEGWHNNHHWDQVSARHGHRWWELDLTWMAIWTLEKLGLATEVVRPRPERRKS
jgi:fatty-acid desaturase